MNLTASMTLNKLEFGLAEMRSKRDQAKGKLEMLKDEQATKTTELSSAQTDIETWRQVQALLSKTSEFARTQVKTRIEQTVTAALQGVLGTDDIGFEVHTYSLGGKPAADWNVTSKYGDVLVSANPEDGRGGGVADVVSLALRLALLELVRPKPGGLVVLDEPAKMVSREYLPNLAEFLKQYARKTGRQILMVTHAEPLAEVADVSYRVTQRDGISEVTRL